MHFARNSPSSHVVFLSNHDLGRTTSTGLIEWKPPPTVPAFVSRMLGEARSRVDETPNRLPIATSMMGVTRPGRLFYSDTSFGARVQRNTSDLGINRFKYVHRLPTVMERVRVILECDGRHFMAR